jgi:hypothetical protein
MALVQSSWAGLVRSGSVIWVHAKPTPMLGIGGPPDQPAGPHTQPHRDCSSHPHMHPCAPELAHRTQPIYRSSGTTLLGFHAPPLLFHTPPLPYHHYSCFLDQLAPELLHHWRRDGRGHHAHRLPRIDCRHRVPYRWLIPSAVLTHQGVQVGDDKEDKGVVMSKV